MVDHLMNCPDAYLVNPLKPYPPFKNGLYMEEFAMRYLEMRGISHDSEGRLYIPVLFLNATQNNLDADRTSALQRALDEYVDTHPCAAGYFVVLQHDDGTNLRLPPSTVIYGACTGDIPLALIYEDRSNFLSRFARTFRNAGGKKEIMCSFVGALTHPMRVQMVNELSCASTASTPASSEFFFLCAPTWKSDVSKKDQQAFVNTTLKSKFALAPRGYGRSSFRFFEIMSLNVVPVYVWDGDIDNPECDEWLPYKDVLDYSTFSISVHISQLHTLRDTLLRVGSDDYAYSAMVAEGQRVRSSFFSLEYMCEYITTRRGMVSTTGTNGTCTTNGDDGNRIVWVTFVNAGYLDYTLNFLFSVRTNALKFELVVYCMDDESMTRLKDESQCTCIDARPVLERYGRGPVAAAQQLLWGTPTYNDLVFLKLDLIDNTFALIEGGGVGGVVAVGYLDMDIVLLQDPNPHVLNEMSKHASTSIFFQCDEHGESDDDSNSCVCSNSEKCSNMCTGCMVFRYSDRHLYRTDLLRYDAFAVAEFSQRNSDQGYINSRLRALSSTIKHRTLPRSKFVNGSYNNMHIHSRRNVKINLPTDCVLVHFNYLIGEEKKRVVSLYDKWSVELF